MAVKIGDLYFDVSADTSDARSSIGALGGAAATAGSLIAGAMSTAFDAVTYAAKTAAAFIAKELIGVGASFNIASQQAQGLFTALTGSAEEARSILQEFAQLSLDQPIFDAATLQKTTSLLLTFQIAKDDALELAKNINLAAIALGKGQLGATQLARAIGQIQGRGWLEGDEARQLSEVGINAYAVMAEAMGITVGKAQELGRQHLLLAEDVIPALNASIAKTFGPVAQSMLNTYTVQAQGVSNIFKGIGSALVDPFIGKTGGGVLVEFLANVREELGSVIMVAEDGSFELAGALAPLTAIAESAAEAFMILGDALIDFLSSAQGSDALGSFASGLADALPAIAEGIVAATRGVFDFIQGVASAIAPIIPEVQEFVSLLGPVVVVGIQSIARVIEGIIEIAAPFVAELLMIANGFLRIVAPVVITGLVAIADAIALIAENIDWLAPAIMFGVAAWYSYQAALLAVEAITATTVSFTAAAWVPALAAVAAQATLAALALGALQGANAALRGDTAWLFEDRPIWEKPFQVIGRVTYGLGAGGRGALEDAQFAAEFDAGRVAAENFNLALLDTATSYGEARSMALGYAEQLGLNETQALDFANVVSLAWNQIGTATEDATNEAALAAAGIQAFLSSFSGAAETAADAMTLLVGPGPIFREVMIPAIEDATDVVKLLENAAKAAWQEVDNLLKPPADATINDFLASLPAAVEDLTEALQEPIEVLRKLKVGEVLNDVQASASKVIESLARDYGLSLREIKNLIGEQGLTAVMEVLGKTTAEAAKAVDPLIAQYGDLGVSVDVVRDAIDRLEERRSSALKAQIDSVTTALEAAKQAAEDAKKAFDEYFMGGTGGLQGAIDSLVLDIPSIGDQIEAGLLQGGPQGEAAVRQGLGQLGSSLGSIFQLGLEQGLTPEQIIELLAPVYGSIQQELGGALNRITTLDWAEGFTPAAAAEIEGWLLGILDPAKIGEQFAAVLGSEGIVSGLETQLDQLNAQLAVDVVFSQEQVQAEIDKIQFEADVSPQVSEEAAQLVLDEVTQILNDADLSVGINNAQIKQEIADTAKAAAEGVVLEFNSELIFDEDVLKSMADTVGGEFGRLFREKLEEVLAPEPSTGGGFTSLLPVGVREGMATTSTATSTVNVNNDIKVQSIEPRASASEMVAASSAAAGSGGRYTLLDGRTLTETYGIPR